jgi:hypothetical protein
MTIDERFERIEHFTAGEAEQRRKDREEDRQLWRETQRRIDDLGRKIADTNAAITRFADETQTKIDALIEQDRRLGERIDEVDRRLGERIESLVSAIDVFLSKQNPQA